MSDILFPNVTVKLTGNDGNAFAILGKVQKALKRAGEKDAANDFMQEAMSGDYDHLLQTAMKYVSVE
jgi:hypothetical protein